MIRFSSRWTLSSWRATLLMKVLFNLQLSQRVIGYHHMLIRAPSLHRSAPDQSSDRLALDESERARLMQEVCEVIYLLNLMVPQSVART